MKRHVFNNRSQRYAVDQQWQLHCALSTSASTGGGRQSALPLDARDAYNLARNRFTASFVDEGSKRDWIETLDTAFAAA